MRVINADAIVWHDYLVSDGNGMYHNEKIAYKSQIDDLPFAQPEQRWIPCEEALPEEDDCIVQCSDDVLITVVNTMDEETIVDYGRTTDGKWYSETADRFIPHGWKPIAWMPLPEPWKEKKNETN